MLVSSGGHELWFRFLLAAVILSNCHVTSACQCPTPQNSVPIMKKDHPGSGTSSTPSWLGCSALYFLTLRQVNYMEFVTSASTTC